MTDKAEKRKVVLQAIQDAMDMNKDDICRIDEKLKNYSISIKDLQKQRGDLVRRNAILQESINEVNRILKPLTEIAKENLVPRTKDNRLKAKISHRGHNIPKAIIEYIKSNIIGMWVNQRDLRTMVAGEFGVEESTAKQHVGYALQYLREQPRLKMQTERSSGRGKSLKVKIPTIKPETTSEDIKEMIMQERLNAIEMARRR